MNVRERHETQCHVESGVFIVPLIVMVIYIYIYIYDSQIVHHNPRFNLFILHNNSFDNQGSKINKNDIFFTFRHTILYKNVLPTYFFHFKDILRN